MHYVFIDPFADLCVGFEALAFPRSKYRISMLVNLPLLKLKRAEVLRGRSEVQKTRGQRGGVVQVLASVLPVLLHKRDGLGVVFHLEVVLVPVGEHEQLLHHTVKHVCLLREGQAGVVRPEQVLGHHRGSY